MALWQIVCGSETVTVAEDKVFETADAMHTKTGVQPVVTKVETPEVPAVLAPTAPAPVATAVVEVEEVSSTAKERIAADKQVLRSKGFALQPGFFADGTTLYGIGTDNARQHRKDFDEMPLATDALDGLVKRVQGENRKDFNAVASEIFMSKSGDLTRGKAALGIEERALPVLATRLGIPKNGYLTECHPELRATNWNDWRSKIASEEAKGSREATNVVLRTRGEPNNRNVFAVVSPKYGAMDVDIIAKAIQDSLDEYKGAKASISYDGNRSRIEILFHTTVSPENQAVGEVFRAGVIVGTDDTGGGSAWVQGSAWFVLCKNYTYTNAGVPIANIRHLGDVKRLTRAFTAAFDKGLSTFDHFLKAWGYAQSENVVSTCKDDEIVGLPVSVVLPGLFRGCIERELVPVRGRVEDSVERLLKHWEDDGSSARKVSETSRASIVNAFTRYAHTDVADPFETSEIERAASALLYSKKPLPFLPAKR